MRFTYSRLWIFCSIAGICAHASKSLHSASLDISVTVIEILTTWSLIRVIPGAKMNQSLI